MSISSRLMSLPTTLSPGEAATRRDIVVIAPRFNPDHGRGPSVEFECCDRKNIMLYH
jgi:hypothetical protein